MKRPYVFALRISIFQNGCFRIWSSPSSFITRFMPFHAMMQAGDLQTYVENYPLYHCILYLCIQWNTHLTYSMDQHNTCLFLCMDPTEAISLAEWCLTFFFVIP